MPGVEQELSALTWARPWEEREEVYHCSQCGAWVLARSCGTDPIRDIPVCPTDSVHWHCRKALRVWYSQDTPDGQWCSPERYPSKRGGFTAETTALAKGTKPRRDVHWEGGEVGREGGCWDERSQADPHFSWDKPGAPENPTKAKLHPQEPWPALRRFGAWVPVGC